jgi:hypothetical protein
MVVAMGILFLVFVVALVAVAMGLRRWTLDEARTEARLHSPETHTVAYAVPEGQDPVFVMAALKHAGFTVVEDLSEGQERLLVQCAESDRGRVREVIEHVHRTAYDGAEVAEHVSFEDER